jgi:hypothetical protein
VGSNQDRPGSELRRSFLRRGVLAGLGLWLTGRGRAAIADAPGGNAAAAAATALRALTPSEARALEVIGEGLVPGSVAAGLVEYVDTQLAGPALSSMLMGKYVGAPSSPREFYRGALEALERSARAQYSRPLDALTGVDVRALLAALAGGSLQDWRGPPAPLVYFVLRCDAVDVTYGTPQGFERLGVPYMPHIPPPPGWGT